MLRVAMLALGATMTIGVMAPNTAAAQSGRERAQGGVYSRPDGRSDSRVDDRIYRDGRCYDRDDRHDKGKKGKDKRRADDRWDNCDDGRWDGRYDNGRKGNGPPFCRDGRGHPVHGREWCRQKGWEDARLRSVDWGSVILRRPRATHSNLGRGVLEDVLGRVIYGRFDQQKGRLGLKGPLTGHWSDSSSMGSVLNLFAGGIQVGQVRDRNRDGRADVILVNYGR